jgi:predicted TIM-barrel fold metal-dependent hydrolase
MSDQATRSSTNAEVSTGPRVPLFSANSHFFEPAHTFEGRLPKRLQPRAPRIVDAPGYGQQWVFEDQVRPLLRQCAVAGTPPDSWTADDVSGYVRFEDMRPGYYDSAARLDDMDADGIVAEACLSSPATMGFGCDLFSCTDDTELGIACVRAWNDWYHEEWAAADRSRYVPIQATWYRDPEVAAAEVRRNAERGFKGVAFRNPTDLDMPAFATGFWDPFLRACEETQTVLFHHTEPLIHWPKRAAGSTYGSVTTLFQASVMEMVVALVWGGVPTRFPNLKITLAETGGSWIPHLVRRMTWAVGYAPVLAADWPEPGTSPLEVFRRSFVFSTLEVDTAAEVGEQLGLDGWMIELDYPHMESAWPHAQEHYGPQLAALAPGDAEALAWRNASNLFRHELPALTVKEPR